MKKYPKHLRICRMGTSFYITLPIEFVRAHALDQHDAVDWLPEADGIKLKFDPAKVPQHWDGEAA